MKEFEAALVSEGKSERIPEEYNFFGKVIGEWDLDWNDHLNTPRRNGSTRCLYCSVANRKIDRYPTGRSLRDYSQVI